MYGLAGLAKKDVLINIKSYVYEKIGNKFLKNLKFNPFLEEKKIMHILGKKNL
jgi:hypothetical protein